MSFSRWVLPSAFFTVSFEAEILVCVFSGELGEFLRTRVAPDIWQFWIYNFYFELFFALIGQMISQWEFYQMVHYYFSLIISHLGKICQSLMIKSFRSTNKWHSIILVKWHFYDFRSRFNPFLNFIWCIWPIDPIYGSRKWPRNKNNRSSSSNFAQFSEMTAEWPLNDLFMTLKWPYYDS